MKIDNRAKLVTMTGGGSGGSVKSSTSTAAEASGKTMQEILNAGMKKRGYEVENGTFTKSGSASETTMQGLLEEGMKKRGYEAKDGTFAKPSRPLEEIRADIDKAQADLDVINKTTIPFFEAEWHKERRQTAQDRVDALKSEWKKTAGWDYDAYGDSTPGITKTINKALDVTGDAVLSGVSQFTTGVANTADLLLGKPLEAVGWKNNPLRVGADIMNQYNAELAQQVQKSAGDSKAAQTAAQVLSATVAAAPMAVMAFLTGGASAATTASLEATAASQGMNTAQLVGQSVSQMMKNPNYWTSFIQEAGNNYREAREWAGSDEKAALYALTVGLVNSGIEVGLDGASGIQGLERAVREGNTGALRQFLDSAGGEALEEIEQGVVSRGVGQLFGSGAKTFSMTDPDAVINPKTMLEEGAMGGAVGALLTGGTYAANAAARSAAFNPFIQAYEMGLARQEAANAPQNAQTAQGAQGVQTVAPRVENAVAPRVEAVTEAEGQTEKAGQGNPVIDAYDWAVQGRNNGEVNVPTEGQKNTAPEGGTIGIIPYNDAEIGNLTSNKGVVNGGGTTFRQFVENAKRLGNAVRFYFGKVSGRLNEQIKAQTGYDVENYNLAIRTDEVVHALNDHGNELTERNRGQLPVTPEVLERIPEVFNDPDEIVKSEQRDYAGREAIEFRKQLDGYLVVLTGVANGRHSLEVDTVYVINKKGTNTTADASRNAPSSLTSETSSVQSLTPNVPQPAPVVNSESGTFNPVIEAYERGKRAQEGGSRSIPAAHVGSTGIDDAAIRGRGAILSPGAEIVNSVVEDALNRSRNRRADVNEILSVLVRHGDDPAIAAQMAEAYRGLTESGAYAVDGAGKLYETGGENDLSLNERQDDSVRLGKRNINAFQFDHPEVHRYFVEAAESLLSDFGMTTRGERIFRYVPEQSNPVVTGVKRSTSAPIVTMLDDLNMTYERAQDVLERIINDKGQENIADAKRVEMLLDDILKHGYESLSGPVEPNREYIETLRRMGQIAPDELTDTGNRRGGGEIRADENGYAVVDDYDEDSGDIPPMDRNLSAAERGFADNAYNRWVENAENFHPEGEKAVRNPSLPTVNPDGLKTSKVGQTVMEAANTPEERVVDIQNRYVKGGLTIASRTNEGLVREAVTKLESDPAGTLKAWQDDVRNGKVSNDLVAMGAALLDSERIKSDGAVFMDVLTDYVKLCSTAGQALQAQRIYKALTPEGRLYMVKKVAQGLSEETGTQLDFKADMVEDLLHAQSDEDMDDALDRIYDHLAAQIPSTFKDKWTALRYLNMLGNFKTQIRNLAGNSLMSGMKAVKNEVAAAIESAVARVNPDMERTQSFRVGKAWMDAAKADFENVREAAQGNGRYDDSSRSAIEQEIQSRRRIFKTRPLEAYRKVTNWATNAGDDIFIKHHYARALAGYLKANGVRVEQFLEGNVDLQLLNRATDFAIREAQEATFHDNNAFSDWVSKLGRRKDTPKLAKLIGEGVAPFRKTPANVLARAYEYSPAGLIDAAVETAKAVKGDATASDVINSLARSLTGTGIMALGFALAARGWIRGTGDEDDHDVDELMNRQDYALVIPGKGSYTIDWLTPATMPFFMGANLWDILDDGEISLADMDSVLAKFTEPILETSMLSGVNDAIANVKFSENHMGQIAATYALSYVMQGLTNSFFGQMERTFEPNRMTTYASSENPMSDWLERALGQASAKIPGIDFQQTEYRDELGHTESNGSLLERGFENLISPGYWTPTHEGEALYDELQDLHDQTGANPWPDAYPPNSFTVSGEKHAMGQEDKEQYQQTRGSIYEDLAGQFFRAKKNLFTPEEAVEILTGIKSYAGAEAKKEFFEENDIDASVSGNYIAKAVLAAKEAKIPFVTYLDYHLKTGDLEYEKGVSGAKKAAVMDLIDSLDISREQKDWLYLDAGYSENTMGDAPWNKKE